MISPGMPLYGWGGLNQAIFLWINGVHAPWWDAIMLAATNAGSAKTFSYWIAAALLLALFRPAVMPLANVVTFSVGFVVTGILVPWLKAALDFPRPLVALGRNLVAIVGPPDYTGSFPSGHAAFVVLMAAALSPGVPRAVKWGLWIFAAVVGMSRIAVGAHFPADIIGGAILGVGIAIIARVIVATARR